MTATLNLGHSILPVRWTFLSFLAFTHPPKDLCLLGSAQHSQAEVKSSWTWAGGVGQGVISTSVQVLAVSNTWASPIRSSVPHLPQEHVSWIARNLEWLSVWFVAVVPNLLGTRDRPYGRQSLHTHRAPHFHHYHFVVYGETVTQRGSCSHENPILLLIQQDAEPGRHCWQ